uniref:chorismate mutase n=1 Tax=Chaetoceros debilis TaxID=122233 RepID=A0A7S3V864_9STRA
MQFRRSTIASLLVASIASNASPAVNAFAMSGLGWGPSPKHMASTTSRKATIDDTAECVKNVDLLSLDSIRSTLIRQEETIIFAAIERSQYRRNHIVYTSGGFGDLGVPLGAKAALQDGEEPLSFLEYICIGTEVLHCGVRRYTSPQEYPFFPKFLPDGPLPGLPELEYPVDLLSPIGDACHSNFNEILLDKYLKWVVPSISASGDDEQHGSTVLADIALLQALSKRAHFGKFVAESKYRSDPEEYQRLVDAGDADGVMELLTNAVVEARVLRRARIKASTYGREPLMTQLPIEKADQISDSANFVAAAAASAVASAFQMIDQSDDFQGKVDPAIVQDIYEKFVIPLTKDVEVDYLFRRCGRDPPSEYAPDRMSKDTLPDLREDFCITLPPV